MSASTGQFYLPRRSCTYDSTTRKAHISHVGAPEGAGVVEAIVLTSAGSVLGDHEDSVVEEFDKGEGFRIERQGVYLALETEGLFLLDVEDDLEKRVSRAPIYSKRPLSDGFGDPFDQLGFGQGADLGGRHLAALEQD